MEPTTNSPQQDTAPSEKALRALILDPDLERLEDLLAEFNLFDVLGIASSEVHHSRTIAWLLNPRGSHNLCDHFLRNFLSQAATEACQRGIASVPFTPADIDGWNLSDVETETEYPTDDGRIDILLVSESDGFVCLMENKTQSGEHTDQLSRYLSTIERRYSLAPFPIYLTPDGRKPQQKQDAKRWIPLGYEKVADLIAQPLETRRSTISANVASFIEQYERTLRRRVLNTPSDIDKRALQIYHKHRAAINRIIDVKALLNVTTWAIDPLIDQYAPSDLQADDHSIRTGEAYRRFFSQSFEEIDAFKKGERWTNSGRMVLFEFMYIEEDHLTLTLMIGPGPQKTRERLYLFGKREYQDPWNHKGQFERGQHFAIYVKPILDRQDFNPFDPDKARPKIEKAIQEFYQNDYWPLVNAIREEFGLSPVSPN